MSKFIIVKEAPEELSKGCFIIKAPNFMDEIEESSKKRPQSKQLTPNYLRAVIGVIGAKYADENFSALTSVNVSPYRGVPCPDNASVQDALFKIFKSSYPQMIDNYVEYHIKKRPFGTKLIYFLGDFTQTGKFTAQGIDEIKMKDVDAYLGKDKKKTVGRPAITDEEATKNSENMV